MPAVTSGLGCAITQQVKLLSRPSLIAHQLSSCGIMFQIPLQAVRSVFAEILIFNTLDVGLNSDNPDIIIVLPIKVASGIAVYCSIQKKCSYVRDDYVYSFIDDTW